MKNILLFLVFAFAITKMQAQFVYKIKADSLLVTNDSCTAELNLENSTKNVKGFLYNKGNGRTEFRKAVKLNDSTLIFGGDTVIIGGNSKNFANSDLLLTGNRSHNGNRNSLNLSNFSSIKLTASNLNSSLSNSIELDSQLFQIKTPTAKFISNINGFHITDTNNFSGLYIDFGSGYYLGDLVGLNAGMSIYINDNPAGAHVAIGNINANRNETVLDIDDNTESLSFTAGRIGLFAASAVDSSIYFNMYGRGDRAPVFSPKFLLLADSLGKIVEKGYRSSSDTTAIKPLAVTNTGEVYRMNSWPIAPPLTLQQVTGYGNTTTNTIKPYPAALPVGASSDSVVVWSSTDSLLKKTAPLNKLTLQQVTTYGNSTTNTIKPYPAALPVGANTDSVVVWSSTDSLLKKTAPLNKLTLQQITTYGNSTTNTIKPYPAALPVGASTDSVVVWSSTDSLLKKIGSIQTFGQTATATISASTVETTLTSSGAGSLTIPAASWFAGKTFRLIIHGTYSTSSTNPANLTFKIKLGTTVIAQNSIFLGSAKSNIPFELRAELTCRTTGSSGTVFTMGMVNSGDDWVTQINNGTSATTVNLSTSQTLNITATLNDNHTGNAVSAYMVLLEAMN